jgi:hypothetical protein
MYHRILWQSPPQRTTQPIGYPTLTPTHPLRILLDTGRAIWSLTSGGSETYVPLPAACMGPNRHMQPRGVLLNARSGPASYHTSERFNLPDN